MSRKMCILCHKLGNCIIQNTSVLIQNTHGGGRGGRGGAEVGELREKGWGEADGCGG